MESKKKFIIGSVGIATIISYLMLFATFFLEVKVHFFSFSVAAFFMYLSVMSSILLAVSFFRHQHVKYLATFYLVNIIIILFIELFGFMLHVYDLSLLLTFVVTIIYTMVQGIKAVANRSKMKKEDK